MKNIINLTPHSITLLRENDEPLIIQSSGLARVTSETIITGEVNGIPVTSTVYGEVTGLPEFQEGTVYIVSALVAQRCAHRNDVFVPNELVRNDEGVIIGCKSLGKIDDPIKGREIWIDGYGVEGFAIIENVYLNEKSVREKYPNWSGYITHRIL